jgi:uncharacterized Zn-finger protein
MQKICTPRIEAYCAQRVYEKSQSDGATCVSRSMLIIEIFNQVRFRTRTKPKGKVTAKRGGRAKCPNGCLKTFSRAQDARRHANETMQCRGGGERKSYPCMQCSEVFTRSDALRRHRSPRGNNPPACKAMQI